MTARPDYAGHDTVAWGLYRLGRYDEAAAPQIAAATANGAADARLLFHKGAIELGQGQTGQRVAETCDARSTLGPALDPNERAEAQRLVARERDIPTSPR